MNYNHVMQQEYSDPFVDKIVKEVNDCVDNQSWEHVEVEIIQKHA